MNSEANDIAEPIAIVGIGCRLPGGADSADALWRLLCSEFDAITTVPAGRFDVDALYDERPATAGRIMSRFGGFLAGVEDFDADFFGIAPREAERLDPQQRLLLETSWEALEDAGLPRERVAGTNTGVFVGMWINEFESRMFADLDGIDFHMTTGSGRYAASGRVSYFLDLLGPSITVDTACSSSLVAVHLACQSLWSGECDLVLAGGANVILQPTITIAYSQSRMMAPDGRCKFGDASADGYVRSDGAAVVALKRLSVAQADGDHVYAVIRGSAVTNDGRASGFLATPGQAGQEEMLRRAYARAGVDPLSVQYVEAHGTGTAAGDPVELGALGAVLGAGRVADQPCFVGSIKTNVGHTEGAAGVAGLIKVALALDHGEIPASLHVSEPNPNVPWDDLRLQVCTERRAWTAGDLPARGGVSAFGITGTNAHVVLEAAPRRSPPASVRDVGPQLLAISAHNQPALRQLAAAYRTLLAEGDASIAELCAGAALRRSHHEHRLAVVAVDVAGASEGLGAFVDAEAHPALTVGVARPEPPRVVFVFPGQGSQWPGMARELLADEPVFRDAMQRCDRAVRAEAGWSPLEQLAAGASASRLDEIDVIQPLLFAIQVALAAQWRAWGIEPAAVVGHSMGEVAAAHVAGALSLEDATAVICRRSALLRRVRGQGAMAVVDLPLEDTLVAIAAHEHELSIAVSNSERSTVISGDPVAVDSVLAELQARDVFCRRVQVDVASHSPQMDPLLDDLRAGLELLAPVSAVIPFHSTVDGAVLDGRSLDSEYWARNLRQPVLFGAAIERLAAGGHTAFVEISPHPILVPAIEQVMRHGGHDGRVTATLRRDESERATMLAGLATLYSFGASLDWPAVVGEGHRRVRLPLYPWQRERFWHEPKSVRPVRSGEHPLLGHGVRPAADPGSLLWQTDLSGAGLSFLRDHVVLGAAIMPAAGLVELAVAAATEAAGVGPYVISDLTLSEALPIDEDGDRPVQLTLEPYGSGMRFRVFSLEPEADAGGAWRAHANGVIRSPPSPAQLAVDRQSLDRSLDAIRARCSRRSPGDAHYAAMRARRLDYASAFRTVQEFWVGDGEALGRLEVSESAADATSRRITLLDGCLQIALAAMPATTAGKSFLPVHVDSVHVLRPSSDMEQAWGHARVTSSDRDVNCCDVTMLDAGGAVVIEARGVQLRRIGSRADRVDDLLYELHWQASERSPGPAVRSEADTWILYTTGGAGGDLIGRLTAAGAECVIVTPGDSFHRVGDHEFSVRPAVADDHRAVLRHVLGLPGRRCCGVVYAWGATIPADGSAMVGAAEELGCAGPVALVQALGTSYDDGDWAVETPRLWMVTRNAQPAGPTNAVALAASQAVVWGTGRVIAAERPALRCTLIDLDGATPDDSGLFNEVWSGAVDRQVALRGDVRSVARMQQMPRAAAAPAQHEMDADAYRLVISEPGSLESLRLRVAARRLPDADEIEVRITASGLNFLDVLKAMGIYPGIEPGPEVALGAECAGVVVAVGSGIHDFATGDEVIAITPSYTGTSMLGAFVTVPAAFVVRRPDRISAADASALPVAYLTAYYALHELGRLRAGERVLIHSATGGVGMAALQICRDAGAEVFATAGTEAKREHLRSLGVEHVFDSRSLAFADEILAATNGRGVNVVLNSLVGAAIQAGLRVLAPRGRFIEIGKRDVYANTRLDLEPFRNNLAFFVVDLAALTEQDPSYVSGLFRAVMNLVAVGRLEPLPTASTPITAASGAFRTMAQAAHIGKLVLTASTESVLAQSPYVRPDSTYVITGGLGALGLAVAQRFVERGARHLALLGRTAPSEQASLTVDGLRAAGADVRVLTADVTDAEQLGAALQAARQTMPPLRGVVHAAGSLADATVDRMDRPRLHAALAPKLAGGWNVHDATLDDPLDFFVLFSSAAAVLGLAGQSNYAAGNAFLDALAHHRRNAGRPALSINWGPWSEIGLAASANRGERLAESGLASVTPTEALDALERLLDEGRVQACVMSFDANTWIASDPASAALLGDLVAEDSTPLEVRVELRERLLGAPPGRRRRSVLEEAVCAQLAPVLRLSADRIDRHRPLKAMGLDSLMALELRNRLEVETGLRISPTVAWNYPTVAIMAEHLAARMNVPLDQADTSPAPAAAARTAAAPATSTVAVPSASHDELEAMLSDELAAVERLLNADGRRP